MTLTVPRRTTEDTATKDHVLLQAQVLTQSFCFFKFLFVCLCTCQDTHVEVRGQHSGVISLLPPWGSGLQWQALLPTVPIIRKTQTVSVRLQNSGKFFFFFPVVGTQIRALCLVGKHSNNEQFFTLHLKRGGARCCHSHWEAESGRL